MNKFSLFTISTLALLSQILPLSLSSPDPYYRTCQPAKCGGVNITFPFHIPGQQKTYCGYPGFEVSCINDTKPSLNISGGTYVINDIWYKNQTVQLTKSFFLNPTERFCPSFLRNLTLQGDVFKLSSTNKYATLLLNCSGGIFPRYGNNNSICGAVALDSKDPEVGNLSRQCKGVVSVPYESDSGSDLTEALRRGFLLNWVANNCSDCEDSGGQCGFNGTTSRFGCLCKDRIHSRRCDIMSTSSGRKYSVVIGSVIASALGMGLLLTAVFYLRRRTSAHRLSILRTRGKFENQNVEAFLKSYTALTPKRYTYADIRKMTGSLKDKIGEGGYGHVYKGKLNDGRFVAVKVLKNLKGNGEEFINEVVSISRTNHVNVVTLLGFCFEGKKQALVYDFLPNGSLDKFICRTDIEQSLSCKSLFDISLGIARGLDYLHRGCNTRILHFDIKPHNILLDEEFCPKFSDFGLARLCPSKDSTISMLEARGTIGYIAPEVFCRNFGGVSHKSDVYSYGMMVLDMVCGRKNISDDAQRSSELYFPQWIYNRLEAGEEVSVRRTVNAEERELQRKLILVSLWCIQTYPSSRPSMSKVVEMLEGSLESLQMPPKPDMSSPSISLCVSSQTAQTIS